MTRSWSGTELAAPQSRPPPEFPVVPAVQGHQHLDRVANNTPRSGGPLVELAGQGRVTVVGQGSLKLAVTDAAQGLGSVRELAVWLEEAMMRYGA